MINTIINQQRAISVLNCPEIKIISFLCSFSLVSEAHFVFAFQALVYDHSGKNLAIELFDEDTDKDDFLGWYGSYLRHKCSPP